LSITTARADDEDEEASGSAAKLKAPGDPKQKDSWLADKLAAAITARPKLGGAKISVVVADLSTGKQLWAHDADKGMNLASNAKLLTSVSALATLGSGFRWHTAVYAGTLDDTTGKVDGDLYVRGKGDPTLSVADLRSLAADVAARGVREISGKIVVDTGYFDTQIEPPHYTEQRNERAGFRAPIASFGVQRSSVDVVVVPEPGKNAIVKLEPDSGDYVTLAKHEVKTVTTGHTRVKVDVKLTPNHIAIEVGGEIRPVDGSYEVRKRVEDPARFAAEVFRKLLADQGVRIREKGMAIGAVPIGAKLIAQHDSAPLAHVLREMNKLSDNYVAETVLKTLGAETRTTPGPATWADGTKAVQTYLATIGIAAGSYRADNGSGLFGASEVSAKQLVTILGAAYADYKIGPDLLASLPVGGVDGTLAKRWIGHPAKGRVRAKTGTLDKVITLAGYIAVTSAHPLAFAILVDNIPGGQRPQSRALADDMIDSMAAYLGAP
jgi:D-alanyl-D-alanine carboxypeptidase/D-alanyl-D-alanine-endopeptidase (penicillin-binding protein 4)